MIWKMSDSQKRRVADGALAIIYIITIYLYTTHCTWSKTIIYGMKLQMFQQSLP